MPDEPGTDGAGELAAPDPRVRRSRARILNATAELLVEGGSGAITMEGIAERSGVAKTTIYRHWTSRSQLVVDAFEMLLDSEPSPARPERAQPSTIREILVHTLEALIWGLTESRWAPAVSTLVDAAERDVEMRQLLYDFLLERRAMVRRPIAAAVARGELGGGVDAELAVDMLGGALFYRRLISREPLTADLAARLADQFLDGGAPRG